MQKPKRVLKSKRSKRIDGRTSPPKRLLQINDIQSAYRVACRVSSLCDLDKCDDAAFAMEELEVILESALPPVIAHAISQEVSSDVIAEDLQECGEGKQGIIDVAGEDAYARLKPKKTLPEKLDEAIKDRKARRDRYIKLYGASR